MKVHRDHTVTIQLDEEEWFQYRMRENPGRVIRVKTIIASLRGETGPSRVVVIGPWITNEGKESAYRKREDTVMEKLPGSVLAVLHGHFEWVGSRL